MVVLKAKSEFGYPPPPQTPYSIISNLGGWEMASKARDGDMSVIANVTNITRGLGQYNIPSKINYNRFLRRSTVELLKPGHGCLPTVQFKSIKVAAGFYNFLGFYPSPHLGGHVTIMLAYSMVAFGKNPEERAYMGALGVREESVRISAGLEEDRDLVDTLKHALEAAKDAEKCAMH